MSEVLNKPLSNVEKRLLSRIWQHQRGQFASDNAALDFLEREYGYSRSSFYKYRDFNDEEAANVEPVEIEDVPPVGFDSSKIEKLGEAAKKIGGSYLKAFTNVVDAFEIDLPDFAPDAPPVTFEQLEKAVNDNYKPNTSDGFTLGAPLELEEIGQFSKKVEGVESLASEDFELQTQAQTSEQVFLQIPTPKGGLCFVMSDQHFPYEDKPAYDLVIRVIKQLKPEFIVLLGDAMDCYAASAHDKDADRATPATFQFELDYTRRKLEELRAICPKARIIYKEGNHETRLSRYINKNAAILSKLKCAMLPQLLDLQSLGIEWIPNDGRLKIGKMYFIHGNEIGGGGESPARLKHKRMGCNFIFGHLHTRDKYRTRAYDGSQQGAYANPCLCELDAEYLHHAHNWSLGFSLIDYDTDETFQVEEIEIIKPSPRSEKAKCNVRGKMYLTGEAKAVSL